MPRARHLAEHVFNTDPRPVLLTTFSRVLTEGRQLRLASAAECARFERESFGALHQMMSGLDESARAATWREIEAELSVFEDADGFVGPCEMWVGGGRRPQG